jgi:uncharacterized protein
MNQPLQKRCTAFVESRCLASGELAMVAGPVKEALEQGQSVLLFADQTGEQFDIDFRGSLQDVLKRLAQAPDNQAEARQDGSDSENLPRGPGRPKLGVVAREVTLLPRQWDWLNQQPGGASVALRKLVDEARKVNVEKDAIRQSREASYRVMSALAGNLPGFEEASRALFAGKQERFNLLVESWPHDIAAYVSSLAAVSFGNVLILT